MIHRIDHIDFESVKQWERSRSCFRKRLDVWPIIEGEVEGPESLSVWRNQCQNVGTIQTSGTNIQCGPFRPLEQDFHEIAPFALQVQL